MLHLHFAFELLQAHHLYLKKSKCAFGDTQFAYLGHIIYDTDVTVDPIKIQTITEWLKPHLVTTLRGFLGLTGYYCKFIKEFG